MEPVAATQDPREDAPAAAGLVWAARGFSCIFWGLPLGIALYFGAVEVRFVPIMRQVPPHLIGVLVICAGAVMLAWARLPTLRWGPVTRQLLGAGAMLLYLGPFVYWYSRMPRVGWYFLLNAGLLVGGLIWLLYLVNASAAEVGVLARDREFLAESRMSGWAVLALTLLPVAGAVLTGTVLARRYQSTLLGELRNLTEDIPFWVAMCLVIPLALTMSSGWKAKELCLRVLRDSADERGPLAGP